MTTAIKTANHQTGTLRNTERGTYHRYTDPETGATIVCVHEHPRQRTWHASTTASHGPARGTMLEAAEDANRILEEHGYAAAAMPGHP